MRRGGSWEKWAWAGLATGSRLLPTVVSCPAFPEAGVEEADRPASTGSEPPCASFFAPDESVLQLLFFFPLK